MKLNEPVYEKNVNSERSGEPAQSRQSICSHKYSKDIDNKTLLDPVDI